MKKLLTMFVLAVLIMGTVSLFASNDGVGAIGVIQSASHPALDQAREGFVEGIREEFGDDVEIVVQNAEGSLSQARAIAGKFSSSSRIKSIYTIGTSATQVMGLVEKEKPIVFSAVTDPSALGLLDKRKNITGVEESVDLSKMTEMIRSLLPEAKRVALLYNPAEINSVSLGNRMKAVLESEGFSVEVVGMSQESEVPIAVDIASRKGDLILTPTDNLVASAISLIAKRALKHKTPLIVSDTLLIDKGAAAACGVDYHQGGKQAAALLGRIIKEGVKPSDLPVEAPAAQEVVFNQKVLAELGIER